jgi:LysM repeat protein
MTQQRSPWRLAAACVLMALAAAGCYQTNGDNAQTTQVSAFIPSPTFTPAPPTETPTPSPTPEPILETEEPVVLAPTETSAAVDQPVSEVGGQAVAQGELDGGEQVQDEFILTATQYVLEITQTASFSETQTAIALGIGATETPIPFVTPTPDQLQPIFTTATPGFTQPVNPGGTCVHEVRAGENLFRLSMTYGVSVADLASASGITNPQLILVGQRINVPGCGTTGVFPPATSQPTVAFDANAQFGTGGSTLGQTVQVQTADGQIVQGQLINGGQGGGSTFVGTTHVVQQYETLFQISQQYGVSVNSIAAANGITNINMIIMGDTLNIPAQ